MFGMQILLCHPEEVSRKYWGVTKHHPLKEDMTVWPRREVGMERTAMSSLEQFYGLRPIRVGRKTPGMAKK